MSQKRTREIAGLDVRAPATKKIRKGIQVGPAHLPDGTYKRHNQRVKSRLIDKAKTRKQYEKLRARLQTSTSQRESSKQTAVAGQDQDENDEQNEDLSEDSEIERDIARARRLGIDEKRPSESNVEEAESDEINEDEDAQQPEEGAPSFRQRQLQNRARKRNPFEKEARRAQQQKQEKEERRKAREEAAREREKKLQEREKFRKAMAKARTGGKNGQRKLGRESSVLLQRIQQTMK